MVKVAVVVNMPGVGAAPFFVSELTKTALKVLLSEYEKFE
jgi:hypothetical protein